jgi:hypothetical protein
LRLVAGHPEIGDNFEFRHIVNSIARGG